VIAGFTFGAAAAVCPRQLLRAEFPGCSFATHETFAEMKHIISL
jgi:hypothetical protein